VKLWLWQRGLPMAVDGGLPSLAWTVTALRLAEGQPAGTSLEVLLLHFFSEMHQLGESLLSVGQCSQGRASLRWQERGREAWMKDRICLFWVDDPVPIPECDSRVHGPTGPSPLGITPSSIPAALAALYVAELRLAWTIVREERWCHLWYRTEPEISMPLWSLLQSFRSQRAPLHIILRKGVVQIGQLKQVRRCVDAQFGDTLHRRDQNSKLTFLPCEIRRNGVVTKSPKKAKQVVCSPCHWICALPVQNMRVFLGDGLVRLAELVQMFDTVGVCHDLLHIARVWRPVNQGCPPPMQVCYAIQWVSWGAMPYHDSRYAAVEGSASASAGGTDHVIWPVLMLGQDEKAEASTVQASALGTEQEPEEPEPHHGRAVRDQRRGQSDDSTRASDSEADSQGCVSKSGPVAAAGDAVTPDGATNIWQCGRPKAAGGVVAEQKTPCSFADIVRRGAADSGRRATTAS